jgi:hypothetical protein
VIQAAPPTKARRTKHAATVSCWVSSLVETSCVKWAATFCGWIPQVRGSSCNPMAPLCLADVLQQSRLRVVLVDRGWRWFDHTPVAFSKSVAGDSLRCLKAVGWRVSNERLAQPNECCPGQCLRASGALARTWSL